jgi:putative hydrolase of the HAD superfamily
MAMTPRGVPRMSQEPPPPGRTKTLWVREPYLAQILSGRKKVEVRVGYDNIQRLRPGDQLMLNDEYRATVHRIGRYRDFEELLAHEDPATIGPDMAPAELLATLRQIYSPDREALGVFALEVILERRYDILLFDMGYTLVYFEPRQEVVVQEALQAIGAGRSVEEIAEAAGEVWGGYYLDAESATFPATPDHDRQTQARMARALLARLGVEGSQDSLAAYTRAIEDGFNRPGVIRPYPEAVKVLTALQGQGYRLGIVSNWSWNLRERVAQAGLDSFFEVIWASAYAGCNKPHPGIFRTALARMSPPVMTTSRVLYVGDSYQHDVIGARNAGIDVVLLDRDGGSPAIDCTVIRDLRGVLDMLGP